MVKCFRCHSKLYLELTDGNPIVCCSLCTARNDETGHQVMYKDGEWKIVRGLFDIRWTYHWYHTNHSTDWYYTNRSIPNRANLNIRIRYEFWDKSYHVSFRFMNSEEWYFLEKSWKTLRTAKKWALVYGLDNEWVLENVKA